MMALCSADSLFLTIFEAESERVDGGAEGSGSDHHGNPCCLAHLVGSELMLRSFYAIYFCSNNLRLGARGDYNF